MKRANGTGYIYKLSGRRRRPYVAGVTKGWTQTEDGKIRQIREPIGYFESKKLAREALDRFNLSPIERPRITLKELYDEWSAIKYPNISKSTIDTYRAAWAKLESLYDMKAKDIRTADMQRVIDRNAEMSQSTLQNMRVVLSMIFTHAMQHDIVHKNYAKFLTIPKKAKRERETFTELEIQTLFRHDDDKWVQSILILIYTGFRVSEMLQLTRFNVDMKNDVLIGGLKTEAGLNRIVPIHPKIKPYINQWLAKNGDTLICSTTGKELPHDRYRKRYYMPTLERLGIRPLTPHCCRHTFATMLSGAGADTLAIQKIIGHADYSTTANIYTHPDFRMLKDAINRL